MTFTEQYNEINKQLSLLLVDRGLGPDDLHTFSGFTDGEKLLILQLLESKSKICREEHIKANNELIQLHQKFTNVYFLSHYRSKKEGPK